MSTIDLRTAYNQTYAKAIENVTTRLGKPATEETLIWAHLFAHTATFGVQQGRSPYDSTLPRISASGDTYPWQYCDQCGKQTSWRTNEYALVPNTLICSACNRANKAVAEREDDSRFEVRSSDTYESELDGMPVPYAEFPIADVTFDNGALEEACRVCGNSPDMHTTIWHDHAYQLGWRVRN